MSIGEILLALLLGVVVYLWTVEQDEVERLTCAGDYDTIQCHEQRAADMRQQKEVL